MDDMIKLILDMDSKARKITEEAEKTKIATAQNLNQRKQELKKHYLERARLRVQKNAAAEREAMEENWKQAQSNYAAKLDDLEKKYQENGDAWVNEIVQHVVSR